MKASLKSSRFKKTQTLKPKPINPIALNPRPYSPLPRIIVTHYPPNFEPCRSTWESYLASCLTGQGLRGFAGFGVLGFRSLGFRCLRFSGVGGFRFNKLGCSAWGVKNVRFRASGIRFLGFWLGLQKLSGLRGVGEFSSRMCCFASDCVPRSNMASTSTSAATPTCSTPTRPLGRLHL